VPFVNSRGLCSFLEDPSFGSRGLFNDTCFDLSDVLPEKKSSARFLFPPLWTSFALRHAPSRDLVTFLDRNRLAVPPTPSSHILTCSFFFFFFFFLFFFFFFKTFSFVPPLIELVLCPASAVVRIFCYFVMRLFFCTLPR